MSDELEQRLAGAFTALADTVKTTDTDGGELPAVGRGKRRLVPVLAAATAVAVVIVGVALTFSRSSTEPAVPSIDTSSTAPSPAPAGRSFPFDLYTHCGVDEALIEGVYFEADVPQIGVARSAPPGWDNPYQRGTITLLGPDRAVFRDESGHEVWLHSRPGATGFKLTCD